MDEKEKEFIEKCRPKRRQLLLNSTKAFRFVSLSDDEREITVQHPGLVFGDYDSYGQPKLWHMMKIMAAARGFAHHYPLTDDGKTFREFEQMTQDCYTFMVSSLLEFTKECYDSEVRKDPLQVRVRGGYVGTSSLNTLSSAYTNDGDVLLMKNITQIVCIDKTTRRPKPLPEWWRERYVKHSGGCKSLRFEDFPLPENAEVFTDDRKITWSDTDAYRHTNWASYVRFCVDAAHLHKIKGNLKHFYQNLENGVQRLEITYLKECIHDDAIRIYLWEDVSNSRCLCFHICKDEEPLFKTKFYFHDS